jgi:hypothetical protein
MNFVFIFPSLMTIAKYQTEGRILQFPIQGNGDINNTAGENSNTPVTYSFPHHSNSRFEIFMATSVWVVVLGFKPCRIVFIDVSEESIASLALRTSLRNVSNDLQYYTASQPRRPEIITLI